MVVNITNARRAIEDALSARDEAAVAGHRSRVNAAKIGLGEAGPTWWSDGAPGR